MFFKAALDYSLQKYSWGADMEFIKLPFHNLERVVDLSMLTKCSNEINNDGKIIITFVSLEYLNIGLNWVESLNKIGINNYLILAADKETNKILNERKINNILLNLDLSVFNLSYVSPNGFTSKGLAITALKFPIAKFLLQRGYDVIISDADAILLQEPFVHFPLLTDIAFQRVAYFPKIIVNLWGFSACSGFIFMRTNERTISFCQNCILLNQLIHSDQLVLNLSLLEGEAVWSQPNSVLNSRANITSEMEIDIFENFIKLAHSPIYGCMQKNNCTILALPSTKFWRHDWIEYNYLNQIVLSHPNSEKNEYSKIERFKKLGNWFLDNK